MPSTTRIISVYAITDTATGLEDIGDFDCGIHLSDFDCWVKTEKDCEHLCVELDHLKDRVRDQFNRRR